MLMTGLVRLRLVSAGHDVKVWTARRAAQAEKAQDAESHAVEESMFSQRPQTGTRRTVALYL